MILAARNDGRLELFEADTTPGTLQIAVKETERYAVITHKDGSEEKVEFYRGSGYLSQSVRSVSIHDQIQKITFYDSVGKSRMVKP